MTDKIARTGSLPMHLAYRDGRCILVHHFTKGYSRLSSSYTAQGVKWSEVWWCLESKTWKYWTGDQQSLSVPGGFGEKDAIEWVPLPKAEHSHYHPMANFISHHTKGRHSGGLP